jgi:hypothetical protein
MLDDIATGALTNGVNWATFLALNVLLGLATLSLGALLLVSIRAAPALVPHAAFLLLLALGLWALVVWFVSAVVGLADPEQQRRELLGSAPQGQPPPPADANVPGASEASEEAAAAGAQGADAAAKKEQ